MNAQGDDWETTDDWMDDGRREVALRCSALRYAHPRMTSSAVLCLFPPPQVTLLTGLEVPKNIKQQ